MYWHLYLGDRYIGQLHKRQTSAADLRRAWPGVVIIGSTVQIGGASYGA